MWPHSLRPRDVHDFFTVSLQMQTFGVKRLQMASEQVSRAWEAAGSHTASCGGREMEQALRVPEWEGCSSCTFGTYIFPLNGSHLRPPTHCTEFTHHVAPFYAHWSVPSGAWHPPRATFSLRSLRAIRERKAHSRLWGVAVHRRRTQCAPLASPQTVSQRRRALLLCCECA